VPFACDLEPRPRLVVRCIPWRVISAVLEQGMPMCRGLPPRHSIKAVSSHRTVLPDLFGRTLLRAASARCRSLPPPRRKWIAELPICPIDWGCPLLERSFRDSRIFCRRGRYDASWRCGQSPRRSRLTDLPLIRGAPAPFRYRRRCAASTRARSGPALERSAAIAVPRHRGGMAAGGALIGTLPKTNARNDIRPRFQFGRDQSAGSASASKIFALKGS